MCIVASDSIFRVDPASTPNYIRNNSMLCLLRLMQEVALAADQEWYLRDSRQYLFPFTYLELFGPQPPNDNVLDPAHQDNKTDFQKQNIRSFRTAPAHLVRGWVTLGPEWTGPFLRLSYLAGPGSPLWDQMGSRLGDSIQLFLKVNGNSAGSLLRVPYNPDSHRYEIELWGYPGDLRGKLGGNGAAAIERGELICRPDLMRGTPDLFIRDKLNDLLLTSIAPDCTMHPILPLHVESAWADSSGSIWDSQNGNNYHYEFNMMLRGWDNFLATGISANPHGGIGFLEYRNLLSNYGRYAGSGELARTVNPWNFDAFGKKPAAPTREQFMTVDYMDLHILRPGCGIGMHRHRDNQEAFFMMDGRGYMVVGDWFKMPSRERCFEIRTLRAGHLAMLKGGQLHGLMNATDEDISLFMFGGYD